MFNRWIITKTILPLLISKFFLILEYILKDYLWYDKCDDLLFMKLILMWIFFPMIVFGVLIYMEPTKISSRILLSYGIIIGCNLMGFMMLSVIPLLNLLIENDKFCGRISLDEKGIIIITYSFNLIGIILWICEIVLIIIYIHKYKQFKNNENDKLLD